MTDGANPVPIIVLFGHTFLDVFDRGGFNIILPEVQDHFDLDLQAISSLAALATVAGIVLSLPVSLISDRGGRRITFLALGAVVASAFSLLAGVATTIGVFAVARAGFGFGLIVNDPVQQSLLSDYTPVPARPSVFSGRQIADNLGNLLGPLAFGLLAFAIGFRAPLFLVAALAAVVAMLSIRLQRTPEGRGGAGRARGLRCRPRCRRPHARLPRRVPAAARDGHGPAAVALDPVPVRRRARHPDRDPAVPGGGVRVRRRRARCLRGGAGRRLDRRVVRRHRARSSDTCSPTTRPGCSG